MNTYPFFPAPLREKCPNTKIFLVQIQENADQKNSVFEHFSHCALLIKIRVILTLFSRQINKYSKSTIEKLEKSMKFNNI